MRAEHLKAMSTFEEETQTALTNLFTTVAQLRKITIRDLLQPEVYAHYEQTLQQAYDALVQVEDAITALGLKLEYQHFRLGGAVDELTPLMIQTRSKSERVMEDFARRIEHRHHT
jgi:hypothetical protein